MHPYKSQPQRAFWKLSVSQPGMFGLSDVYAKKFPIKARDWVATAGSCFAQHLGERLRAGGFRYLDADPAPDQLPPEQRRRYGYETYSARFGNVYTARQLLQLYQRAFDEFTPTDQDWVCEERYFDAFRTTIEPGGFGSAAEMRQLRAHHLSTVRHMFDEADVFVFTLGLTEAWISRRDGAVYPLCPGTTAGEFSHDHYRFHNFTFEETVADLEELIARMRRKKPSARLLLTVSPVPLVATGGQDHVLVATMHSKSILRAAAGQLANRHDCVDYFPSYELLASPPMRATFFAPNLREIASAGVDYAMSHFFRQHSPFKAIKAPAVRPAPPLHEDDLLCDEALLEEYAR